MARCYHWDLSETGECAKCATLVTVTQAVCVTVGLGTSDKPPVSGQITVEWRPSVRDAIALALSVTDDAIDLVDVTPKPTSWEGVTAKFRLAGSKVDLVASIRMTDTLTRSPEVVEYDEEKVEA